MITLQGSRNSMFMCSPPNSDAFNRFWSRELEQMGTSQILQWVVDHYGARFALATAFEPGGCLLAVLLSKQCRKIDVIETSFGYPIYDTDSLKAELRSKYEISLRCQGGLDAEGKYHSFDTCPRSQVGLQRYLCRRGFASLHGSPREYDILVCCDTREQVRSGENLPILEWDSRLSVAKVYPLARWTKESIWTKIDCDSIPYSPFFDGNSMFQRPPQRESSRNVFDENVCF